ncbi:hypothetical protein KQX54_007351 [Cotesia glomerata]|uniref:Uncharacterized protein n=1 Tax=Cotesia glomerata TaxID=32391 RepID=A0AAV7IV45_COTGL|nr:hypothetical protein KQX54_007351 [Cotesia glomerata]
MKLDQFHEIVGALQWHPEKSYMLLAGSEDKTAKLFECRMSDTFKMWEATGELSTKNVIIECINIWQGQHLWKIKGHETEITGLSLSSSCSGFLVTSSADGIVKEHSRSQTLIEPVQNEESDAENPEEMETDE